MKTNKHFRNVLVAASAGALLSGSTAFANHEVYVDTSSDAKMAHPSAELRTDYDSRMYDPAGAEVRVYHRDASNNGMSAGFNSDVDSNADIDAQADSILRMYQKGKMPAEITDREYHQVNGQTLFPRFQATRGDYDTIHTDRSYHARRSETVNEPAGASVSVSSNNDLSASSNSTLTVEPSVTTTTNDWQKGYFNSQSNRGAEIKDPAGADISVRATQNPDLAPSAEVKSSISTDSSVSASPRSDVIITEPSVNITTDNSLSSTNSQLGGINNQNKDSSRLSDKNSSNRVNEPSSSLNTSTSSDSEIKANSDAAIGGINNQSKDSQKSNGNDSTVNDGSLK